MTSQPGLQTIAIYIVQYLIKNYVENETGRVVPDLFLLFQKA